MQAHLTREEEMTWRGTRILAQMDRAALCLKLYSKL